MARTATLVLLAVSLSLLALPAQARQAQLAWDFDARAQPTAILIQACIRQRTGCPWREAQRLGPRKRLAHVQVPTSGGEKCFRVVAQYQEGLSDPSNVLCPQR